MKCRAPADYMRQITLKDVRVQRQGLQDCNRFWQLVVRVPAKTVSSAGTKTCVHRQLLGHLSTRMFVTRATVSFPLPSLSNCYRRHRWNTNMNQVFCAGALLCTVELYNKPIQTRFNLFFFVNIFGNSDSCATSTFVDLHFHYLCHCNHYKSDI